MAVQPHLVLAVPLLMERPVIGSGCCVILPEDIIRSELACVDGVDEVEVDQAAGRVAVRYAPERLDARKLVSTLAEVGYPAARLSGVASGGEEV